MTRKESLMKRYETTRDDRRLVDTKLANIEAETSTACDVPPSNGSEIRCEESDIECCTDVILAPSLTSSIEAMVASVDAEYLPQGKLVLALASSPTSSYYLLQEIASHSDFRRGSAAAQLALAFLLMNLDEVHES